MKKIRLLLLTIATFLIIACSSAIFADATAPYQNPIYTPTFTVAPIALSTGAQNIIISTFGASTLAGLFSGTCTSLAATAFGSVDNGVTWSAINAYIAPSLGTSAGTVATAGAITTTLFKLDTAGFNKIKIAVSALTAACTFSAAETAGSFTNAF
ncbi:MAG: hypothetical protein KGI08_05635 [Thaumarchaeota archaeon]|nr:hypothetical protein [Nitrososphaerota archaeon]